MTKIKLVFLNIVAIAFFLQNCAPDDGGASSVQSASAQQYQYEQTLTNNQITRCGLGLMDGVSVSTGGIWDAIKGIWSAIKYVVETDIDILVKYLSWSKTMREIATERLAEKGAKQRELVTTLVDVMFNAVPLAKSYLKAKYEWYDRLPVHYQSEFLCKLLLTVPVDIIVAVVGAKGINKIGEIEGLAEAVDKMKDALNADAVDLAQSKFKTTADDWTNPKSTGKDDELEDAVDAKARENGGASTVAGATCTFALTACPRPDGGKTLGERAKQGIAIKGWETAYRSSPKTRVMMISEKEQKALADKILTKKYESRPNNDIGKASEVEKVQALEEARLILLEEAKDSRLKSMSGHSHEQVAFESVRDVPIENYNVAEGVRDSYKRGGNSWTNERDGDQLRDEAFWAWD